MRVVEVIPGRPTVGIEIPNPHRAMIRLREVIDSDRYQHEASALTLALGQDIGGGPVVANLGKIFPYIPPSLNRVLLHFSQGAPIFYETTDQMLEDLAVASSDVAHQTGRIS